MGITSRPSPGPSPTQTLLTPPRPPLNSSSVAFESNRNHTNRTLILARCNRSPFSTLSEESNLLPALEPRQATQSGHYTQLGLLTVEPPINEAVWKGFPASRIAFVVPAPPIPTPPVIPSLLSKICSRRRTRPMLMLPILENSTRFYFMLISHPSPRVMEACTIPPWSAFVPCRKPWRL